MSQEKIYIADYYISTKAGDVYPIKDVICYYKKPDVLDIMYRIRSMPKTVIKSADIKLDSNGAPSIKYVDYKKRIDSAMVPRNIIRNCATWNEFFTEQFNRPEIQALRDSVKKARETATIYPEPSKVLEAFNQTPYDTIKAVIIGQDPYHTVGHAHGLAFSSLSSTRPPSLEVIFREIYSDVYAGRDPQKEPVWSYEETFTTNDLTCWAKQGVLLMNYVMTVEKDKPASHSKIGWYHLSDSIISFLNNHHRSLVFMLWGKQAQQCESLIDSKRHLILKAAHPAAELYSKTGNAGFYGCRHFTKANLFIINNSPYHSKVGINWATYKTHEYGTKNS